MNILAIGTNNDKLDSFKLTKSDIIVVIGQLNKKVVDNIYDLINAGWVRQCLFVPVNKNSKNKIDNVKNKITVLNGEGYTINETSFFGTNNAKQYKRIPKNTSILITNKAPDNILSSYNKYSRFKTDKQDANKALLNKVKQIKPLYHVFLGTGTGGQKIKNSTHFIGIKNNPTFFTIS